MTDEATCVHCGGRIIKVNYALGPSWVHQPPGSAFMDNTYISCRLTVATPPECTEDHG